MLLRSYFLHFSHCPIMEQLRFSRMEKKLILVGINLQSSLILLIRKESQAASPVEDSDNTVSGKIHIFNLLRLPPLYKRFGRHSSPHRGQWDTSLTWISNKKSGFWVPPMWNFGRLVLHSLISIKIK